MTVPYQAILVPLDGSALSEQALPHAAALAQQAHAELTLLRVVPPLIEEGITDDLLPPDWTDLDEQQRAMVAEGRCSKN
jgi:nucleotide-binding universal stress UspA family protein